MERCETTGEAGDWATGVAERLTAEHPDVPGDVIAEQLRQVSRGIDALGGDERLREVAILAAETNIGQIARALGSGGDYPGRQLAGEHA